MFRKFFAIGRLFRSRIKRAPDNRFRVKIFGETRYSHPPLSDAGLLSEGVLELSQTSLCMPKSQGNALTNPKNLVRQFFRNSLARQKEPQIIKITSRGYFCASFEGSFWFLDQILKPGWHKGHNFWKILSTCQTVTNFLKMTI